MKLALAFWITIVMTALSIDVRAQQGSSSSFKQEQPGHFPTLYLKNNLQHAQVGDFLVVAINKTFTILLIQSKKDQIIAIEEIAVPEVKKPRGCSWRDWILQKAPGNSSWVRYGIDLNTGKMTYYYSFTKKNWFEIAEADNFLSKLLNLKFSPLPDSCRKRVGPKTRSADESRSFWEPQMIVEGQAVPGIHFDAWRTRWPKDKSELSEKMIEIYLPKESGRYPSYFPYWLQISGLIGKAKVRIVDSGSNLRSPQIEDLMPYQ